MNACIAAATYPWDLELKFGGQRHVAALQHLHASLRGLLAHFRGAPMKPRGSENNGQCHQVQELPKDRQARSTVAFSSADTTINYQILITMPIPYLQGNALACPRS